MMCFNAHVIRVSFSGDPIQINEAIQHADFGIRVRTRMDSLHPLPLLTYCRITFQILIIIARNQGLGAQ